MKRFIWPLFLLFTLAVPAGAASCNVTPAQDAANAQLTAMNAANAALRTAYYGYALRYSNIKYKVLPGKATLSGNSARVVGNISVQGTSRATGQRESNTLRGTVTLVRSGCGWRTTGYKPGG